MTRKIFMLIIAVFAVIALAYSGCYAADEKNPGQMDAKGRMMHLARHKVSMFDGTIEKIDSSDPANTKLFVKAKDGAEHTVVASPRTNVTRICDVSDLKSGETVRVMARSEEGKDMAVGILFGKIKNLPAPVVSKVPSAKNKTAK
jgi:hypothetical protein